MGRPMCSQVVVPKPLYQCVCQWLSTALLNMRFSNYVVHATFGRIHLQTADTCTF